MPELLPLAWPGLSGVGAAISLPGAPNLCPYLAHTDQAEVAANRASFVTRLGLRGLASPKQMHGDKLVLLNAEPNGEIEADALASSSIRLGLGVFTADCIPVLAVRLQHGRPVRVLAIHAGRKGIANHIAPKALAGSNPADIGVWLGPAICAECYEIDGQCAEECLAAGFARAHITPGGQGKFNCDLRGELRLQLRRMGIHAICELNSCTRHARNPDGSPAWYSHRNGDAGRMMSAVWLNHQP